MCTVGVLQERGWESLVYNQGMHSYPTLDLAQCVAVHRFALASGSHA